MFSQYTCPRILAAKSSQDVGKKIYESFSATTLNDVKKTVYDFLTSRDKTEFVDVIEYNYVGASHNSSFALFDCFVGFVFRVARVSVAKDSSGRPKLEQPIEIDDQGIISVETRYGETCGPEAHKSSAFPSTITFSIERWRKCCAIRDGIARLDEVLSEILGDDGESAALKLDTVRHDPLVLAANNGEEQAKVAVSSPSKS